LKRIWFDFTNPPHVNLYLPLLKHLESKNNKVICTARHFVETMSLLTQNDIPFKKFGEHGGKSKIGKIMAFAARDLKLFFRMPKFDISVSSNYEAPQVSWLRGKTSIIFDDNDISPNWLYAKFASFVVCPEAINKQAMIGMGINPKKLITYKGYKEDIYIASFQPDPKFLDKLPFQKFVTVRPENLFASYVTKGSKSIVPELIEKLTKQGHNILYLPRYDSDRSYVQQQDNVFIPRQPLNGLDVCYYSDAVLTGAGTFSREAALMGTPAVSFYAGNDFLSVDKKLFSENRIFFSRQVDEIIEFLSNIQKQTPDLSRSIAVQKEVFSIVDQIVNR
jgi:predicted glycosyltransferase